MNNFAILNRMIILFACVLLSQAIFAQKTSEPPETMAGFFQENFPLEPTLKQIDADIARFPNRPDLWQTRAVLLGSHGKHEEAMTSLERALALIPEPKASPASSKGKVQIVGNTYSSTLFEIGLSYLALDRREDARKALRRAALGRSPHMMACTYLGNMYLDEGNSAEALKYYELMKHNLSTSGKISKGNALYNLKRYDEAIEEYKVAAHWKPELPSVLRHLGDAYFRVGSHDKAIEFYQRYIKFARQNKIAESEIAPVVTRLEQLRKNPKSVPATKD
ncbi:MAG: tetratricopeptide repeat protein [Candidatus Riflebacteria bacterium]|nr:tetratricopeptide repeat protein [Candidatus Riflebacteria bacterium]